MKLMRSTSLFVAVAAVLGVFASEASAQTTVTWQQLSSTRIRVDWTPIPGATSYDVFVTNLGVGPVPVPTTFFVVDPPPGTYVIQVRGRAGAAAGPLSEPLTVNFAGGPAPGCAPVAAPSITVGTSGSTVNVSWAAVAGAVGYRLQVGTSPGATQFQVDLPAAQTGFSSAVPMLGTFYVRVIAGSACGALASSAEQSFSIGAPTPGPGPGAPNPGAGPRTADPPAGQLIPRASLGYLRDVVTQVAARYGGDLHNSCTDFGGNHTWLFRLVQELRRIDTRWGLNDKRGNRGDMSHDIVTYNPTNRADANESQIYLFDVIGGHCGSNPGPNWADVTDATWNGRGSPACGTEWCARWTLDAYIRAGFQP